MTSVIIQFIIGFVVGLSGAMMPGPLLLFTISRVLASSWKSVFKIVGGHVIVEVGVIAAILLGVANLLRGQRVIIPVTIVGAAVLICFGLVNVIRASKLRLPRTKEVAETGTKSLAGGLFFSAFNPSFSLWWAATGAVLLRGALEAGPPAVVSFVAGHWASDLGWYLAVACAASRGRDFLTDRVYQAIVRLLGFLLIFFALLFVAKAFAGWEA